jgi:hypothetical protein
MPFFKFAGLYTVVLCCVALRCVVLSVFALYLCCVVLCCVVLCCVVLCCVVLCCVVFALYLHCICIVLYLCCVCIVFVFCVCCVVHWTIHCIEVLYCSSCTKSTTLHLQNLDVTQHKLVFDGPLTWRMNQTKHIGKYLVLGRPTLYDQLQICSLFIVYYFYFHRLARPVTRRLTGITAKTGW